MGSPSYRGDQLDVPPQAVSRDVEVSMGSPSYRGDQSGPPGGVRCVGSCFNGLPFVQGRSGFEGDVVALVLDVSMGSPSYRGDQGCI